MIPPISPDQALDEAITALGYIKPSSASRLLPVVISSITGNARSADEYRKEGEQLSPDQKKRLGIRANAFFSLRAMDDLTEKGLANPMAAHQLTIRRASFSISRRKQIIRDVEAGVTRFTVLADGPIICPACAKTDGLEVDLDSALSLPPSSCTCDCSPLILIADVHTMVFPPDDKAATRERQKKPSVFSAFISAIFSGSKR